MQLKHQGQQGQDRNVGAKWLDKRTRTKAGPARTKKWEISVDHTCLATNRHSIEVKSKTSGTKRPGQKCCDKKANTERPGQNSC